MRISFERRGGLANIPFRSQIESAELTPKRAAELQRLVDKALPFDQSNTAPAPGMSDQFQYEITIQDGGRTHQLRTSDEASSADLKLLCDFLGEAALDKLKRR
jgi:hypothetical protein